jgi:hypothetical protein
MMPATPTVPRWAFRKWFAAGFRGDGAEVYLEIPTMVVKYIGLTMHNIAQKDPVRNWDITGLVRTAGDSGTHA